MMATEIDHDDLATDEQDDDDASGGDGISELSIVLPGACAGVGVAGAGAWCWYRNHADDGMFLLCCTIT